MQQKKFKRKSPAAQLLRFVIVGLLFFSPLFLVLTSQFFSFDIRNYAAGITQPGSVVIEGALVVNHKDNFENGTTTTEYFLQGANQKMIATLEPTSAIISLPAQSHIRVSGKKTATGVLIPQTITPLPTPKGSLSVTPLGNKKVAMVLLQFSALSGDNNPTPTQAKQTFDTKVKPFFSENSFNQLTLNTDVYGWYTSAINPTCDDFLLAQEAIRKADAEVTFSQYQHLLVVFPGSCPYGGSAFNNYVFITDEGLLRIPIVVIDNSFFSEGFMSHELGHNYGFNHANGWDCGLAHIGPTCTSRQYADSWDEMGGITDMKHFSASRKLSAQWITPSQVPTVPAGQNGLYTISPIELKTTTGNYALRIGGYTATTPSYFIESRFPTGFDSDIPQNIAQGILIRLIKIAANGDTQLLDGTPTEIAGSRDFDDAAFSVNQPFSDPDLGATVQLLSKTNGVSQVGVVFAPFLTAPADYASVSRTPTLRWSSLPPATPTPSPNPTPSGPPHTPPPPSPLIKQKNLVTTSIQLQVYERKFLTPGSPAPILVLNTTLPASATSYTFSQALQPNTTYRWKMRVITDTGISSPWVEGNFVTN